MPCHAINGHLFDVIPFDRSTASNAILKKKKRKKYKQTTVAVTEFTLELLLISPIIGTSLKSQEQANEKKANQIASKKLKKLVELFLLGFHGGNVPAHPPTQWQRYTIAPATRFYKFHRHFTFFYSLHVLSIILIPFSITSSLSFADALLFYLLCGPDYLL